MLWSKASRLRPRKLIRYISDSKSSKHFFLLRCSYKYSQRILLGLICSCVGDALLNINLFLEGMGAFAIGHIWYISAFGWKPLRLPIGVALYICGALGE